MTLHEIKTQTGVTYRELATVTGMKRSNVCRAIVTPWRTRLQTFLIISRAMNVDDDAARGEWHDSKVRHELERIERASEA